MPKPCRRHPRGGRSGSAAALTRRMDAIRVRMVYGHSTFARAPDVELVFTLSCPFVLWCGCAKRVLLHEMVSTKVALSFAVLGRSPLHPLMVRAKPTIVELDMNKLEEILRRLEAKELGEEGTVYDTHRPGVLVRLVGQAPVGAKVYYLQKLRCNLCGVVFTAQMPEGVGPSKGDATVGSMIALLKYGTGMPFHRAEKLQESLRIPLPASTQGDIVEAQAKRAGPVFDELVRQAAQGAVVHNDDTGIKILEVMAQRAGRSALAEEAAQSAGDDSAEGSPKKRERTGTFTSGIVATRLVSGRAGHKIVLFLSGRQHAGENLRDVLTRRAAELPPPIQMCDALSRNLPEALTTILANCLAYGRRQFVDVANRFPQECRHVLESLSLVYHNDALARQQNLSPDERLLFHQRQSGPTMESLRVWLVERIEGRLVESNSALGGATAYLLRHWEKLTLFLRMPGAPQDWMPWNYRQSLGDLPAPAP